ncbi:MAG: TauD/TfdA family dioxygenase [Pseudomonadota bacterium]
MITIEPTGGTLGARVYGVRLADELTETDTHTLRRAWLEHQVLIFPEQHLTVDEQVRATRVFGPIGDDPFFKPVDASEHVVAISRLAHEQAPLFAESWHTDWSFKPVPPAGTLLQAITVPPVGGTTSFANQTAAARQLPTGLRQRLVGAIAQHSAAVAYAPEGMYGDREREADRSMRIRIDVSAREVGRHPVLRPHPETGIEALFGTLGYIAGIDGMATDEAQSLMLEVHNWQTQEEFQYEHCWEPGMVVLWDNRCLLHRANGGFEGHDRLLHRTTVADDPAYYLPRAAA